MKTYLIAANWKQNGTSKTLYNLTKNIISLAKKRKTRHKIVLFPPAVYLSNIFPLIRKTKNIFLGAQNISPYSEGAFTGEISAKMIKEVNCNHVIIGHSERRHIFGETDKVISSKVSVSAGMKLNTILCIGETNSERRKKRTKSVISRQLKTSLLPSCNVLRKNLQKLIIAYEPVWSIGTGIIPKKHDLLNNILFIKKFLRKNFRYKTPKVLYGGSVSPENIKELSEINQIDGFLIGSASQNPNKFIDIIKKTFI